MNDNQTESNRQNSNDKDDHENKDEEDENSSDDEHEKQPSKKAKKEEDPNKDKFEAKRKSGTLDVQEQRTVFVRNISFDATEETIQEAFSTFGPIKYVKLCIDKELERPKGTAFIQFETSQSAINACAESDIFEMDSRSVFARVY